MTNVKAVFASIPYDIESHRDEAYFHTIFYLMMSVSGLIDVQSSVLTNKGRIDLVLALSEKSISSNSSATRTLKRPYSKSDRKTYAARYRHSGKKNFLLGLSLTRKPAISQNGSLSLIKRSERHLSVQSNSNLILTARTTLPYSAHSASIGSGKSGIQPHH